MSVHSWGENLSGKWRLEIYNDAKNGPDAKLSGWSGLSSSMVPASIPTRNKIERPQPLRETTADQIQADANNGLERTKSRYVQTSGLLDIM